LLLILVAVQLSPVGAEEYLVKQGDVSVDVQDIDAVMNNVPAATRAGVLDNPVRIQQYIKTLMMHRIMSRQAQAAMIGEDPLVQREIQQAIEKLMSKHLIETHLANMDLPDLEPLAKEQYQIYKQQYVLPESVDVSHLLITVDDRTDEEALERIQSLRQRVVDGEDIAALASEYSEDPSAVNNAGRLQRVVRGNMVPSFEKAAFALSKDDPISDIVKTKFGYHIIMLREKEPARQQGFEEVKDKMMAGMRKEQLKKAREDYIDSFSTGGPAMEFNAEAIELLRTRYADGTIPGHEE